MILAAPQAMVKALLRDDLLRRLLRNTSYLLTGTAGASFLALVALALTARSLGPELLGVLAMIQAYAGMVDRARIETWPALIKYGAEALEEERYDDFKSLIKFGFLVDVGERGLRHHGRRGRRVRRRLVVRVGARDGPDGRPVQPLDPVPHELDADGGAAPVQPLRARRRAGRRHERGAGAARRGRLPGRGGPVGVPPDHHERADPELGGPDHRRLDRAPAPGLSRRHDQLVQGHHATLPGDLELHLVAECRQHRAPEHPRARHPVRRRRARSGSGQPLSHRQEAGRDPGARRHADPAGRLPRARAAVGARRGGALPPHRDADRPRLGRPRRRLHDGRRSSMPSC